jgi:hypothetical protein
VTLTDPLFCSGTYRRLRAWSWKNQRYMTKTLLIVLICLAFCSRGYGFQTIVQNQPVHISSITKRPGQGWIHVIRGWQGYHDHFSCRFGESIDLPPISQLAYIIVYLAAGEKEGQVMVSSQAWSGKEQIRKNANPWVIGYSVDWRKQPLDYSEVVVTVKIGS